MMLVIYYIFSIIFLNFVNWNANSVFITITIKFHKQMKIKRSWPSFNNNNEEKQIFMQKSCNAMNY